MARAADSLTEMIRDRTLRKREKLLAALPITGELLRGSLLERVVRHKSGCPKCARGEGHQVYVLTVGYGRGQTQQISVRKERVAEVRRWLDNYQKLNDDRADLRAQSRFAAPRPHQAPPREEAA